MKFTITSCIHFYCCKANYHKLRGLKYYLSVCGSGVRVWDTWVLCWVTYHAEIGGVRSPRSHLIFRVISQGCSRCGQSSIPWGCRADIPIFLLVIGWDHSQPLWAASKAFFKANRRISPPLQISPCRKGLVPLKVHLINSGPPRMTSLEKLKCNWLRTLIIIEKSLHLCIQLSPNYGSESPTSSRRFPCSEGRGLPRVCTPEGENLNSTYPTLPCCPCLFEILIIYTTKSGNLVFFVALAAKLEFLEAFKSWHFSRLQSAMAKRHMRELKQSLKCWCFF